MENHERKTRNGKSGSGKTKLTLSASSLVLQMKCSTAVEGKNAICWISKYDFRLAGSPKDPGAIINHLKVHQMVGFCGRSSIK